MKDEPMDMEIVDGKLVLYRDRRIGPQRMIFTKRTTDEIRELLNKNPAPVVNPALYHWLGAAAE